MGFSSCTCVQSESSPICALHGKAEVADRRIKAAQKASARRARVLSKQQRITLNAVAMLDLHELMVDGNGQWRTWTGSGVPLVDLVKRILSGAEMGGRDA